MNDSKYLARPEEERITQAEKHKHMQAQLKVGPCIFVIQQ